ncbi:MAG: elongation factor Ts [Bacteroidetes bacterium]|mgnify:FL=1|nr:elongation factor Ts [Bacteroidota bacterium]MBT5528966.1 elongation factor Ts [Cytophagia bacterium]MBT3421927.1 elongation factor Ts [Bacteroidota bacterium]MBT3799983.1 elongation factor Ts [Bacteroidota bacterium]MBT3933498.1 elongation factor Ts [Bacteroidota bacterium]
MGITAADIAKLRKTTGAGMMDCKKALNETNGDFEKAIDFLRKQGKKISAKRADRDATEGVVIALTSDDNKKGVVVELNCETDFVAKNADYVDFATKIAQTALENTPATLDELKSLSINDIKVSDLLDEQIGKIGEKIELSNYHLINGDFVVPYIHIGNKIGVLVNLNKAGSEDFINAGKDVAMQVAAMNPVALNKESVSQSVIDRELEIAKEQIKKEGKPEAIADKIAQGKLNKFFKENTLLEQDFVKDSSKTVSQFLGQLDKELTVKEFVRVALGS